MKRLYVDMDGTLAEFKPVDTLETLYEEGYFRNLQPHHTVVDAVKNIIEKHPDIEVNILSSVLSDSKFALEEKNAWLDQYLPEVDMQHRIFPPCGAEKKNYIQGGVTPDDYLLDDYSTNLHSWEPPAKGIKLLNGINATKGTWTSDRIRFDKTPEKLAESIVNVMNDRAHYQDEAPRQDEYLGNELTLHEKLLMASKEVDYSKLGYMPETFKVVQTFLEKETQIEISTDATLFLKNCSWAHMSEGVIREFEKKILENNGEISKALIEDKIDALKATEMEMKKLEYVIEKDIREAGFQTSVHVVDEIKQLNLLTQRTNTMAEISKYSKMPRKEIITLCGGKESAAMMVQSVAETFRKQELDAKMEQLTAKAPKIDLNLEEGMEI